MAGFSLATARTSTWQKARRDFGRAHLKVQDQVWLTIRRVALVALREMKKGLSSGAPGGQRFAPLSPFTIALRRKRSRRPLLNDGDLRNSITMKQDKRRNAVFVGVLRTARDRDGQPLMNIAVAHEYGTAPFTIEVTPAMRRFFLRLFMITGGRIRPLSASTTMILHPGIPARPFVRPIFEMIQPQIGTIVRTTMGRGLL